MKNAESQPLPVPEALTLPQIKERVHRRLLETLDLGEARRMPAEQLQKECSRRVDILVNEQRCPLFL